MAQPTEQHSLDVVYTPSMPYTYLIIWHASGMPDTLYIAENMEQAAEQPRVSAISGGPGSFRELLAGAAM